MNDSPQEDKKDAYANLEISGSTHGWGPFGLGGDRLGSARVQAVLVGTLVVDIADARTGAIVWRTAGLKPCATEDRGPANRLR